MNNDLVWGGNRNAPPDDGRPVEIEGKTYVPRPRGRTTTLSSALHCEGCAGDADYGVCRNLPNCASSIFIEDTPEGHAAYVVYRLGEGS